MICSKAHRPILTAFLVVLSIAILIVTYLNKRTKDSFGERYASSPQKWMQINYDSYYSINIPLYYLHRPLAWLDQKMTGVEIRVHLNDFGGNKDNYSRESYN